MNWAHNLLRDHAHIAAMLQVLTASAARLQHGHYVDPAMLHGLDRFLQRFVRDCCFRKDQTVFLPHVRAVLPDETARTHACAGLRARCLVPMTHLHGVVERERTEGLEPVVAEFAAASAQCVERIAAYLQAERPLLDRVLRRPPQADDNARLEACVELERRYLGATGREWYGQLVSDYADIARSWSTWPATDGAPAIDSGRSSPPASAVEDRRH